MINKLDLADEHLVDDLLKLQYASYRVEAELIGFFGIPGLRDTRESLRACGEIFFGFFDDEEKVLMGAIAIEEDDENLDISRVVVHPDYFRRGIARAMVRYVLETRGLHKKVIVSTGSKNIPAVTLYKSMGFAVVGEKEVAPEIFVTLFEKGKEA